VDRIDGKPVVHYTRHMFKTITSQDAAKLIESGEVIVVDVREHNEWVTGHIPGAQHAPLSRLRQAPKAYLQRDKIIFVCAAGSRSKLAAQLADAHGMKEVYNLSGGTNGWRAAGFELQLPQQQAAV
jgi:rhodanese-related sulfurtransferase